jgi:short-subunit dehydrogenase
MKALVTGAGSGIGQAVADALHARGDHLVLLARNEWRAVDLRERYNATDVRVADLADPGSLARIVEDVETLDAVVHAAGVVQLGPVADLRVDDLTEQLTVNLVAPAALTKALLPALREARGTVVFVNSGAGLTAHPEWSAYAASKFGLRALADSLRAEEAAHGVRVTTIYPGRTATPMQEKVHQQEAKAYNADDWTTPGTVAATILHVLDLPTDATIPDLILRPAPR